MIKPPRRSLAVFHTASDENLGTRLVFCFKMRVCVCGGGGGDYYVSTSGLAHSSTICDSLEANLLMFTTMSFEQVIAHMHSPIHHIPCLHEVCQL